VKLDVEVLSTVPEVPPVAGPERALDPPLAAPLPNPGRPDGAADGALADGVVAEVDEVDEVAA
jgi:hypothetical protein